MNVSAQRADEGPRSWGPFCENAEYKYATERQGYVSARLGQLNKRLAIRHAIHEFTADRAGYAHSSGSLDIQQVGRSG